MNKFKDIMRSAVVYFSAGAYHRYSASETDAGFSCDTLPAGEEGLDLCSLANFILSLRMNQ